jgi:hypothetical protein
MDHFCYALDYYSSDSGRRYDMKVPVRSQLSYLSDMNGNILLDFVGRFENLNQDFATICEKIGIVPFEIPQRNVSHASTIDWRVHYDKNPQAVDFVLEHWGKDVEAFGYSKP